MSLYSLFIFLILFETLQIVFSGEESFNRFDTQLNKKPGLESAEEASDDKEFNYESNGLPSDEKVIEKRRLFFSEEEANSAANIKNNDYLQKRRTNFSEVENEQMSEFQQRPNNRDNEKNRFSLLGQGGNFRNSEDSRSRQSFVAQSNPTQRFEWEARSDNFGKSQPRWNEENKFKSFENSAPNPNMGDSFNGRMPLFNNNEMNSYSEERNQDAYSRRMPITTLSDREIGPAKNYNERMGANDRQMEHGKNYNERMGHLNSGSYLQHQNMHYHNKHAPGFWSTNFNTPEKGVIINFNTECPKTRQFSENQLVHRFLFPPKASVGSFRKSDIISSPSPYDFSQALFL